MRNILSTKHAIAKNTVMKYGKGVYLFDANGKKYIDCAAGTFNLSLGYGHEEVIDAAKSQMDKLIHLTSSYASDPIMHLIVKLKEILPSELNKIHLKVSGGSVANEGAIKMAEVATGKQEIISFYYSHLGQTIFTLNASGNAFRAQPFLRTVPGIVKAPAPYCARCFYNQKREGCGLLCAKRLHDIIEHASSGKVAAIIIEPIFGNGDNIIPPDGFLKELREICNVYEIALIFDEIQTGMGRTGKFFASQYFNVTPDFITIAKGLGGTGFQIAAIAAKEKYTKMDPMHHSFTYGSNLMAAAAGIKTIEIMQRPGFLENVTNTGNYIKNELIKLTKKFHFIGEVRGIGLMIGFEIVNDRNEPDVVMMQKIQKKAFANGLILRSSRYGFGNTLKIRPPLILTMLEAKRICQLLEKTCIEINAQNKNS